MDVFPGLAMKPLAPKKYPCLLPNHQLAIPAPLNNTSKGNVFIQLHQRIISWWFQTAPMNSNMKKSNWITSLQISVNTQNYVQTPRFSKSEIHPFEVIPQRESERWCVCVCVLLPPPKITKLQKAIHLVFPSEPNFGAKTFPKHETTSKKRPVLPLATKTPLERYKRPGRGLKPICNYYMGPQETQLNPMRISNHVSFLLLAYKQQFPLPQKSTRVLEATKQSGSTNGSPLISIGPRMMHNCFARNPKVSPLPHQNSCVETPFITSTLEFAASCLAKKYEALRYQS